LRTPARGGDWTTPIGGNPAFGLGPTTTGPAVDAGRVYVTLGGRYLRALDPANGATIWSVEGSQLAPVSSTAPTIANGALYHGTQTGTLVARNPATGAVLWSDTTAPHHHGHHRGRGRQRRRLQLPLHRHHRPSPLSGRSGNSSPSCARNQRVHRTVSSTLAPAAGGCAELDRVLWDMTVFESTWAG
jgi:hypothetical protein